MTSCKHSAITFLSAQLCSRVFATRSEYIANNYCEQCSSQNIRSIFLRYSHKDSFNVREHLMLGHHRPARETPFQWRFAGGPMMAHL